MKQIPTKTFVRYLKSKGIVYIRSESSHDIYDRPGNPLPRPLVIRTKYKDIPLLHIHTCLLTLGVSKKDFEEWLRK
ncbi:MAG: hypothetical protein SFU87_17670 [Chitinophagaceae bacterium]|nr:hypothetical protein [Chitinophagaceae bacterium]